MSIAGKKLVFTGTLSETRAKCKAAAIAAGASVVSSVSGRTNILVCGEGVGDAKIAVATAHGMDVMAEKEFWKAVTPKKGKGKGKSGKAAKGAGKAAPTAKKKTATGGGAGKSAPAKASRRSTRGKAKAAAAPDSDDDAMVDDDVVDEGEEVGTGKQAASAKAKAKAKGKGKAAAKPAPKKAPAKKAATGKKRGRGKAKAAEVEAEEAEEKAEEETPPAAAKKQKTAAKKPKAEPAAGAGTGAGAGAGAGAGKSDAPRGRRPDSAIPAASTYAVHGDYDVKLNQTNVGHNNNKFYILQLLSTAGGGSYRVWTRWGRVGERGQSKLLPAKDLPDAIRVFEKKFKDKTKNNYSDIACFVKHPGKYQLVETADEPDGEDTEPLGRLSKEQIERGQAVLDDIEAVLTSDKKVSASRKRSDLVEHSSQFFSLIPTNFGRRVPEPITDMATLNAKRELLKFWLRMGFDDVSASSSLTPIGGVMALPLPPTLDAAAGNVADKFTIDRCRSKGAELSAKARGHVEAEMYASILLYTSNAIYSTLNAVLRNEDRRGVQRFFRYLRLFLAAMDHLPAQSGTLWRGISVDLSKQYTVGKTITWWGVSSLTSEQSVARGFMRGMASGTFVTVRCKRAVDISAISLYAHEKESLLAPGTQLKVLSNKRVGTVAEIELEEVGRVVG